MGNWKRKAQEAGGTGTGANSAVAPSYAQVTAPGYGISKEFAADNAVPMPGASDTGLLAAAKMRRELLARSGRASTNLSGTMVYSNTFLGSVG